MNGTIETNIVGRYSKREAAVSASADNLLLFADGLQGQVSSSQVLRLRKNANAAPYSEVAHAIVVRPVDGLVSVSIEPVEHRIIVQGGARQLGMFGEAIRFLVSQKEAEPRGHIHLEYYDNHPFIAPESMALVVELVE